MTTAKEVLEKYWEKWEENAYKEDAISLQQAALAAMKEAVELAWDAGYNKSVAENQGILLAMCPDLFEIPNKEEFINSLFPESE